jgi:hypothetical protein
MAIVKKTSETRHRQRAKATIRYIMHRRERGERITRALFSDTEGDRQRLDAYRAIDAAPPGSRFLRVTISPDPKREDTRRDLNFRELTRATLVAFCKQFPNQDIQFFASVHEGHTDKRHVNMLVIFPGGRLTKEQWSQLREEATENSLNQRRRLDRQLGQGREAGLFPFQARMRFAKTISRSYGSVGSNKQAPPSCPLCMGVLEGQGRFLACGTCHIKLTRENGLGLTIRPTTRFLSVEREVGRR